MTALREGLVLAAGALLWWLAFPNEVVATGVGWLGPLVLAPLFWFAYRRGPLGAALGALGWTIGSTALSQGWLGAFHPLALPLVLVFTAPVTAVAVGVLSYLARRHPAAAVWTTALTWTVYEFVRVQGFLGYPYGGLAATFWAYPVTFQSADLVGTLGLTFLLAWTSAWVGRVATRQRPWTETRRDLLLGAGLWALDLGYGVAKLAAPETGTPWTVALVQPAQDPWKGGPSAYAAGLDALTTLSDQGLARSPDVVVWPETAFVPSVVYHTKYRDNPDSLALVRRLEDYLGRQNVPFLLGNDHREKAEDGSLRDYNAVLAWDHGWQGRYEKNRLVPFTESFPYKDLLPFMYQWLLDADTHFWEPGRGRSVLVVGGVKVGTPVCYEDAFAAEVRDFSRQGAQVLVNLTNDSWAPGQASRWQHLALAVFRSVETRLPLVRAGNDGATVALSARGEVRAQLPVGPAGVLVAPVVLGTGTPTLAVFAGDAPGWGALVLLVVIGVVGPRKRREVDKA